MDTLDSEIRQNNKIPENDSSGCCYREGGEKRYTTPEEIASLAKYLKAGIKNLQDSIQLDDTLVGVPGEGGRPAVRDLQLPESVVTISPDKEVDIPVSLPENTRIDLSHGDLEPIILPSEHPFVIPGENPEITLEDLPKDAEPIIAPGNIPEISELPDVPLDLVIPETPVDELPDGTIGLNDTSEELIEDLPEESIGLNDTAPDPSLPKGISRETSIKSNENVSKLPGGSEKLPTAKAGETGAVSKLSDFIEKLNDTTPESRLENHIEGLEDSKKPISLSDNVRELQGGPEVDLVNSTRDLEVPEGPSKLSDFLESLQGGPEVELDDTIKDLETSEGPSKLSDFIEGLQGGPEVDLVDSSRGLEVPEGPSRLSDFLESLKDKETPDLSRYTDPLSGVQDLSDLKETQIPLDHIPTQTALEDRLEELTALKETPLETRKEEITPKNINNLSEHQEVLSEVPEITELSQEASPLYNIKDLSSLSEKREDIAPRNIDPSEFVSKETEAFEKISQAEKEKVARYLNLSLSQAETYLKTVQVLQGAGEFGEKLITYLSSILSKTKGEKIPGDSIQKLQSALEATLTNMEIDEANTLREHQAELEKKRIDISGEDVDALRSEIEHLLEVLPIDDLRQVLFELVMTNPALDDLRKALINLPENQGKLPEGVTDLKKSMEMLTNIKEIAELRQKLIELDVDFLEDLRQKMIELDIDELEDLRQKMIELDIEEIEDLRQKLIELDVDDIDDLRKKIIELHVLNIDSLRQKMIELDAEDIEDLRQKLIELEISMLEDLRQKIIELEAEDLDDLRQKKIDVDTEDLEDLRKRKIDIDTEDLDDLREKKIDVDIEDLDDLRQKKIEVDTEDLEDLRGKKIDIDTEYLDDLYQQKIEIEKKELDDLRKDQGKNAPYTPGKVQIRHLGKDGDSFNPVILGKAASERGDGYEDPVGRPIYKLPGQGFGSRLKGALTNPKGITAYLRYAVEESFAHTNNLGMWKSGLLESALKTAVLTRDLGLAMAKEYPWRLPGSEFSVGSLIKKVSSVINGSGGSAKSILMGDVSAKNSPRGNNAGSRRTSDDEKNSLIGDGNYESIFPGKYDRDGKPGSFTRSPLPNWKVKGGEEFMELLDPKANNKNIYTLRDSILKSPWMTSSSRITDWMNESRDMMTLDSNHVWEIKLFPYCGVENGEKSFLPSIDEINARNEKTFGYRTHWKGWIPFAGFEMQKAKLTSKNYTLYDGSFDFPTSIEFTNDLRLTIVDDTYKSWKWYFERALKTMVYNCTPNNKSYYEKTIQDLPKLDELHQYVAPYKNCCFRCIIYSMNPQMYVVEKFDLLVVLKDTLIDWQGESDASSPDLSLSFSIVGENPKGDIPMVEPISLGTPFENPRKPLDRFVSIVLDEAASAINSTLGLI